MALRLAVACAAVIFTRAEDVTDEFMARLNLPQRFAVATAVSQAKPLFSRIPKGTRDGIQPRQLESHAHSVNVSEACKTACPGVTALEAEMTQVGQEFEQKHSAIIKEISAQADSQTSTDSMSPQEASAMIKKMEPLIKDITLSSYKLMCKHEDTYLCLATATACTNSFAGSGKATCSTAEQMAAYTACGIDTVAGGMPDAVLVCGEDCKTKSDVCPELNIASMMTNCGGRRLGGLDMQMQMEDPAKMAQEMKPVMKCICEMCPASQEAMADMTTSMTAAMATGLSSVSSLKNLDDAAAMQALAESMQQDMMKAICPMVGMGKCFQANPTECSSMLDSASTNPMGGRRLTDTATFDAELAKFEKECKDAGISTVVQNPEQVKTTLTISGLDYDKVMANTNVKNDLISKVKKGFLDKMTGYVEGDLSVTLSKGSVKADVVIVPIPGATGASLQSVVNQEKDNIATAVVTDVKAMPAVDTVLESGATTDSLTATASSANVEANTSFSDAVVGGTHRQASIGWYGLGLSTTIALTVGISVAA
jgi:hypothetical protein